MKYWEIIADNLSKAGWGRGCVSVEWGRQSDVERTFSVPRSTCALLFQDASTGAQCWTSCSKQ
jgi:hypothetical protein